MGAFLALLLSLSHRPASHGCHADTVAVMQNRLTQHRVVTTTTITCGHRSWTRVVAGAWSSA